MRWSWLLVALLACPHPSPTPPTPPPLQMDRAAFNQRAALLHVPVFWADDATHPGQIDPGELVPLWTGGPVVPVENADGTPTDAVRAVLSTTPVAADARQQALMDELSVGRPTVVLTEVAPDERPFVEAMLEVASAIEALHALQRGSAAHVPADDPLSRAVFWRNQGPWCEQSEDPACAATTEPALHLVGVYPPSVQSGDFCAALEAHDPPLMEPFTTVVSEGEALRAVPLSEAFPDASQRARSALDRAADPIDATDAALAAYLRAAGQAFVDDSWFAADQAWLESARSADPRWYVRVGPDETYWEPCDRKAGYHLVFARINPASVELQQKLEPLKQDLEHEVATRAAPYTARTVAFSLPEFIDIVVNAGDSRSASGGTTGQSLPNWGPVAETGGRTVAMTNLNQDPDSLETQRARAASLLCSMEGTTDDPEPLLVSTVLHEAAHNLGPASGYTVNGQTDEQAFGGELATMLEELKAQTAAMFLTDFLAERGVVTREFAHEAHVADFIWMLGQISAGMEDAEGGSLPYAQLSAIQLGLLLERGAVTWQPDTPAANGRDTGCFALDHDGLPAAIEGLATEVFGIKGRADVARARALKEAHAPGPHAALFDTVTERWSRAPLTTFVYGFRFAECNSGRSQRASSLKAPGHGSSTPLPGFTVSDGSVSVAGSTFAVPDGWTASLLDPHTALVSAPGRRFPREHWRIAVAPTCAQPPLAGVISGMVERGLGIDRSEADAVLREHRNVGLGGPVAVSVIYSDVERLGVTFDAIGTDYGSSDTVVLQTAAFCATDACTERYWEMLRAAAE
ncbi:MAG: hypothetical protein R3F61_20690 [Myxococcota bacterium]